MIQHGEIDRQTDNSVGKDHLSSLRVLLLSHQSVTSRERLAGRVGYPSALPLGISEAHELLAFVEVEQSQPAACLIDLSSLLLHESVIVTHTLHFSEISLM